MKTSDVEEVVFSQQLSGWLKSSKPKTIYSLNELFGEKSFAVIIMLLLIIPALPIPTGGITHVFEVIVMLLCLELIAGFKKVWLPDRWKHMKLGKVVSGKAIPQIIKRVEWLEKHSRSRWDSIFRRRIVFRIIWIVVFAFTLVAFLAPPFSGLDTLPALGGVLICLSLILGDAVILLAGLGIGGLGTFLIIGVGATVVNFFQSLF